MFRYLKNKVQGLILVAIALASFTSVELCASPKKSYTTPYSTNSYTKKPPFEGYGKPSKVNGLPKNKIVSGHAKETGKGYTYVNPYARSK